MKAQILLVEDNAVNRKLVSCLLELEGYEVRVCVDARQAFDELSHGQLPDLVLMDVALPGMDGLALTRGLRAQSRFATLPIVALTASAMKGDDRKALDAGCNGYITKPIDVRRFPVQIAQHLVDRHSKDDTTPDY